MHVPFGPMSSILCGFLQIFGQMIDDPVANSNAACNQQVKFFHIFLVAWRVTLLVAFDFWPQNIGRCRGSTNAILSFYDCRLNG